MTSVELVAILEELSLSQTEAARLLGVSVRSVRRWIERSEQIPGPAEHALVAWKRLKAFGLPWRPDSQPIGRPYDPREIERQVSLHRQHAVDLERMLTRVEKRGGPMGNWKVDLTRQTAVFGKIEVSFYRLKNGGFSPQVYTRRDMPPDYARDLPLIEDALYCVAQAIAADRRAKRKEARK